MDQVLAYRYLVTYNGNITPLDLIFVSNGYLIFQIGTYKMIHEGAVISLSILSCTKKRKINEDNIKQDPGV